jgi:hypothetical protein
MKRLSALAILLAALLSVRCDLFNQVDDIGFNAELSESLTVSDNTTGTNKSISQSFTVDALDNPEIEPYKDKLKGITVEEIRYRLTSFTGDNTSTLSGNVVLQDASTNATVATVAIAQFNLNDAFAASTEFVLPLTEADYTAVSNLLLDSKTAKATVAGTISKTPVSAVIEFTFKVRVTAEVLN